MSKIEWTDETWNPVVGCSKVSEGCRNCYAERMAKRLKAMGHEQYQDVVDKRGWTGKVSLVESALDKPLKWRKPRTVFVCSMSDLFHYTVPDDYIFAVFMAMAKTRGKGHIFQVLTKRPKRMRDLIYGWILSRVTFHEGCTGRLPSFIWLGVSVEDQATADYRIPLLLETPAAVRFVSYEPALGPVKFVGFGSPTWGKFPPSHWLNWIICGGESGPGARMINPDWARSARDQCVDAGVPFFFKNWGGPHKRGWLLDGELYSGRLLDGRTWDQMPQQVEYEKAQS